MRLTIKLTSLGVALSLLLAACNLLLERPMRQPPSRPFTHPRQRLWLPSGPIRNYGYTRRPANHYFPHPAAITAVTTQTPFTAVPTQTPKVVSPPVSTPTVIGPHTSAMSACPMEPFLLRACNLPNLAVAKHRHLRVTPAYSLVFSDGNSIVVQPRIPFIREYQPGKIVDVSVNLTAPASEGSYRGNWMLRNAAGKVFGLGGAASEPFMWISRLWWHDNLI